MNLTRNQIIIIGAGALLAAVFILIFLGILPGFKKSGQNSNKEEVNLSFWGVENLEAIRTLTDSYQGARINYRQFDKNNYESALLNALAGANPPDIFMVHNSWLLKHGDKMEPMPANWLSLEQFGQLYPDVAKQDFTSGLNIFAMPLYIDTLAFIYNKDFFNAKGVALVPKTWSEFQQLTNQTREIGSDGKILKAAAAIGGSEKTISNASDVLALLMTQFGAKMFDYQSRQVDFKNGGEDAFNFYLQFGNPVSRYYTWSDDFRYSPDAFAQEEVGVIFNYSSVIPFIKEKNPYINVGISEMLQLAGAKQPINYADYWGLAVSKQSKNSATAWHFIYSVAASENIAENYFQSAGRPPALRSLIQRYINDAKWGVFARQALTAKSWPRPDNNAAKQAFSSAIENALSGRLTPETALENAQNKINSLYNNNEN